MQDSNKSKQEAPLSYSPRLGFDQWRRSAHAIGVVQTRFLMLLIYVAMVLPTGFLFRMRADPLHLAPPESSNWTLTDECDRSLERARQQF